MKIKTLIDEDFTNYKKPSMFIGTTSCNWKCCKEQNLNIDMCQNSALAQSKTIEIPNEELVERYKSNLMTQAIVIGGLEPFDQYDDLYKLLLEFRKSNVKDDVIIYTGYNKDEIDGYKLITLSHLENIIVKFGRYIPNSTKTYDILLGVYLASENQYAERL